MSKSIDQLSKEAASKLFKMADTSSQQMIVDNHAENVIAHALLMHEHNLRKQWEEKLTTELNDAVNGCTTRK